MTNLGQLGQQLETGNATIRLRLETDRGVQEDLQAMRVMLENMTLKGVEGDIRVVLPSKNIDVRMTRPITTVEIQNPGLVFLFGLILWTRLFERIFFHRVE